jgi:hypothetical protein
MARDTPLSGPRGVSARIVGPLPSERFQGAAVLRTRPHPLSGEPVPQLGVPDDALGFRPRPDTSYHILLSIDDAADRSFLSCAVWLERVQSSWWFVLSSE